MDESHVVDIDSASAEAVEQERIITTITVIAAKIQA